MITMESCQHVLIEDIHGRNGPQQHFSLRDMQHLTVRGVSVRVDVVAQRDMLARRGLLHWPSNSPFPIPTFPLNTDGVCMCDCGCGCGYSCRGGCCVAAAVGVALAIAAPSLVWAGRD